MFLRQILFCTIILFTYNQGFAQDSGLKLNKDSNIQFKNTGSETVLLTITGSINDEVRLILGEHSSSIIKMMEDSIILKVSYRGKLSYSEKFFVNESIKCVEFKSQNGIVEIKLIRKENDD